MKNLATIAIVSIAMYGCASSPASQTYSPYNVTGVGNTCDQARDIAFRIAVEQSFGTAVMAERQVKNDVLTRDEILSHSSGFIENYAILNTEKNSSGCTVKLTATVKPSMVNQYVFNDSRDSTNLNGQKINAQVSTYLDERNRSDALLNELFTDYVRRAYKVKQDKVEFIADNRRETYMVVNYEISMNNDFLKALDYTLSKVQEKCSGNCSQKPKYIINYVENKNILPTMNRYFFMDMQTPELVNRLILGECGYTYNVKVNVYNNSGNVIYSQLYLPKEGVPRFTDDNGWGYGINSILWNEVNHVNIPLSKFSAGEMKRVEVSLVDNTKKINGKCL
jgi:hypothetical protein